MTIALYGVPFFLSTIVWYGGGTTIWYHTGMVWYHHTTILVWIASVKKKCFLFSPKSATDYHCVTLSLISSLTVSQPSLWY